MWFLPGAAETGNQRKIQLFLSLISLIKTLSTLPDTLIMIIQTASNSTFLLPLYILQDSRSLRFPHVFILIFDILLHFLAFYYVIKCIYIVWSIRTFHKNLTILVVIFGAQWFEAVTGNVLMKPYEVGKVSIGNGSIMGPIKQFFEVDPSGLIVLDPINRYIPLLIGGFLRFHFIFSMTTVVLGIAMERAFACWFLVDYEKKQRNFIWISIFLFCQCYNLLVSSLFFFHFFHFYWFILFSVLPNVLGCVLLNISRLYNLQVTKTLENFSNPDNYNLAARFQAKENFRCFKMITSVINVGMGLMVFTSVLTTIIYFNWFPDWDTLLNFLFQGLFSAIGPLVICPCILNSVESWRNCELLSNPLYTMVLKRRRERKVAMANNKYNDRNETIKKDTDTHFDQLKSSWN